MTVSTEHIAIRPGYCGGKPHIAGHRVKVSHIAVMHEDHVAFARAQHRMIFTHDEDYVTLHSHGVEQTGIASVHRTNDQSHSSSTCSN